ncbi:MAG: 3-isopropylmalate dehydrogenase [Chloroflexota bacterium]|nr:3-isopropylmalate dehydrogenase [Chloroflexota bacterium]
MKFNIAYLPGDGIGPEVASEAVRVLQTVCEKFGHKAILEYGDVGGVSIDRHGTALTDETLAMCRKSDAVLLGAVGGPKWDDPDSDVRPEDGLLALRKGMRLFANLRPVKVYPMLVDSTNLKPEVVKGVDLMVVRELTGGLYFGKPKKRWRTEQGRRAVDSMVYTEQEIERIMRVGFEMARSRRKKLASVDKQNVLMTSRLWREIAIEMSAEYPDVELEHVLVDACTMRLIQRPAQYDVIVTENTFGDIITDEASMLAGSMGMLASASLSGVPKDGARVRGMYEPIHGSAPGRANQNLANPIATIMSVAMMLRYSLGLPQGADMVEKAVDDALADGCRTYDIMSDGMTRVSTREMGDAILRKVREAA